jgi:hypothetical protein
MGIKILAWKTTTKQEHHKLKNSFEYAINIPFLHKFNNISKKFHNLYQYFTLFLLQFA